MTGHDSTGAPVSSPTGTLGTDQRLSLTAVQGGGPAFDSHRPPSAAALVSDCVHCGFCLPACPPYTLWGEEMDSPRGRIYLMNEGLQGEPLTPSMVEHFDACLGCMACVTACPSVCGTTSSSKPPAARWNAGSIARGRSARCAQRSSRCSRTRDGSGRCAGRSACTRRADCRASCAEPVCCSASRRPLPPWRLLRRRSGARAGAGAHPREGAAPRDRGNAAGLRAARVLPRCQCRHDSCPLRGGLRRDRPRAQGCCGALSAHNGREAEAQRFARALIDTFEREGVDYVVVNAAGCGSTMKEYADLLSDDAGYAERAPVVRGPRPGRLGDPGAGGSGGRAPPAAHGDRLPRLLPPLPRPGRPGAAARAAARHTRSGAAGDRRGRPVLRLRRYLQHSQPRGCP